jgi:hypothetical protein
MSDAYDDYESKMQLAEHAWEQALEEKQEPVGWLDAEMSQAYTVDELPDASGTGFLPLYTAPPKKQWVGLTDDEIEEMHNEIKVRLMGTYRTEDIYRSIEAKLREKNT